MLALAALSRVGETRQAPTRDERIVGRALLDGVSVRDQIRLGAVADIGKQGIRTLIDLRPDGEAPDQPPSSEVAKAAASAGLRFAYVPTPNGAIPDATVDALAKALAGSDQPVLLYCRSGSRAARVWALAEASRPGGASASVILSTVNAVGQKADDLVPRIEVRIAARGIRR